MMARIQIKSLHHKLVLSVVLMMVLLATATTVFVYLYKSKAVHSETEQTLKQLLDTVSLTASIAAYSKNEQIAKDVLGGLLKNSVVQSAHIGSHEGFSLNQEKQALPIGISVHRKLISPFNTGEVIGTISLHSSIDYSQKKVEQSTLFSLIVLLSLVGVTTLIVLWKVKHSISDPLSYISNTLHAIAAASAKRIPLLNSHEQDELGQLGKDINTLLDTLETQFDAEHTLREKVETIEQQLRHIYNSSSAGLFVLNQQGTLLNYNSTFKRILNNAQQFDESYTTQVLFEQLLGQQDSFDCLIKQALSSAHLETQDFSLVQSSLSAPFWIHCLLSKITEANGNVALEGVIFDMTERVHNEKMIKREAYYDHLTGMLRRQPTKIQFEAHVLKSPSDNISFLLLDLDGFKQINDTYGHLAGDEVLSIVSERLFKCVRSSDLVCRLGGDEFLILLMSDNELNLKKHIAKQILDSIKQPISLVTDELVSVGVSIGMTDLRISNTTDFDLLIKDADEAMYQIKKTGKNNYQIKTQCLSN